MKHTKYFLLTYFSYYAYSSSRLFTYELNVIESSRMLLRKALESDNYLKKKFYSLESKKKVTVFLLIRKRDRDRRVHERPHKNAQKW